MGSGTRSAGARLSPPGAGPHTRAESAAAIVAHKAARTAVRGSADCVGLSAGSPRAQVWREVELFWFKELLQ